MFLENMNIQMISAFAILVVSLMTGRYFSIKAVKELDGAQQILLTETLYNFRLLGVFPPIILVIMLVVSVKLLKITLVFGLIVFFALLIIYTIILYILMLRKMFVAGITKKYIINYIISRSVSTAGLTAFFIIMLLLIFYN